MKANQRVDELKERIRVLVETPLFFNGDLIEEDLIQEDAKILQIIHKQHGIYSLLRAAQVNQRRCLQQVLEQKQIGMTSLTPGVYDRDMFPYLQVPSQETIVDNNYQNTDILDPSEVSKAIVDQLLDEKVTDLRSFVSQSEWSIYKDFP